MVLITAGVVFSLFISLKFYNAKQEKAREAFQGAAREQIEIVREFIGGSLQTLDSMEAFYLASDSVSQEEFRKFTAGFLQQGRHLLALGWLVPIAPEQEVFKMEYLEPYGGQSGEQKTIKGIAGPDILVLESGDSSGELTALKPFFDNNQNLAGVFLAKFDMDMLIQKALVNEKTHALNLRMFKYGRGPASMAGNGRAWVFEGGINIGRDQWVVEVSANRTMPWQDQWDVILLFLSSLLFLSFIGIQFLLRAKREERIEREVKRRTDELEDANSKLKGSIVRQEEAEALLKRKAIQFQLIYEATSIATNAHTLDEALNKCMVSICKVMSWPIGHIFVPSSDGTKLVPTPHWHCDERDRYAVFMDVTMRTCFAKGEGLPGRVWHTGEAAWIKDIYSDGNFPRASKHSNLNIKSAFAFPVVMAGETISVVEFFHFREIEVNNDLVRTVQIVKEQLSRALENKAAQQELSKEKERLEIFQRVTINRELEMIQLKRENNELSRRLGKAPAYDLSFLKERPDGTSA